ncbi:sugar ABC transporter substrate-binding protein [Amycolatopsis viridis]|uniref:Simple sugar transport system substrate-binding protein n=1 Tax=Amycolatopsis viridis TaxID=185678 RepID=A0ABX0SZ71_9PSEU|nr:substrate-binding domain-containing protein [Amycolatopsis viridis]NIH82283.1 simple sugar transport system substrate-binding protein [Amycolatopsis viridis]
MKRRFTAARRTAAIALAAGLLVLAGCTSAPVGGNRFTACVTTLFPTGTFAEFTTALQNQGAQHGMTFDVQDVNNDSAKENQVLTACGTRKVDMVIASVVSPTGSLAALRRLNSSGVPVICYNTCLNAPDDQQLTRAFVTNDQRKLGATTAAAAADYIRTKLGGKATIAYLTCETYDVCKQRREGLDQGLAGLDIDVAAAQEGFVVDKATPVATSILAAHPDVDVFLAENEDGVVAAANAIRARGLTGKAVVFGIGINPTVGQLLLDPAGTVVETTGQDAASWAGEVIKIAEQIHSGQNTGPYEHYTPGPAFTHDNPAPVQEYLATHAG